MSRAIKNCPFCGGEAQTDFIDGESYLIECYSCGAETGSKDSESEAVAAWNRRATASIEPEAASASIVRYSPNCVTGVAGMMKHPHGSYVLLKDHVGHCAQQVADWKSEAERHKEANQILLSKFFDMANERDTLLSAEHRLSDAYIRLRGKLHAFDTPQAPTPEHVWAYTEAKLDAIIKDCDDLRAKLAARIEPAEPVAQVRTDIERVQCLWIGPKPPHGTLLYAAPQPIAQPRTKLRPCADDDGQVLQWWFDCDGHYIDVEKDAQGKYSIFFRDRSDRSEGWLDQAEQSIAQPAPKP